MTRSSQQPDGDVSVDRLPALVANYRPPKSKVIGLFGFRGDTKSLSMTAMGLIQTKSWTLQGVPAKLYSNYWIAYADRVEKDIATWAIQQMEEAPPETKWPGLLLVDEITAVNPTARWMSDINLYFGDLCRQLRKRGLSMLYTTQFPNEVPPNLWRQTDIRADCRTPDGDGVTSRIELRDLFGNGGYRGEFEEQHFRESFGRVIFPTTQPHAVWHTRDNRWVWPLYDTDEITVPSHYLAKKRKETAQREKSAARREELQLKLELAQNAQERTRERDASRLEDLRHRAALAAATGAVSPGAPQPACYRMLVSGYAWEDIVAHAVREGVSPEDLEIYAFEQKGLMVTSVPGAQGGQRHILVPLSEVGR